MNSFPITALIFASAATVALAAVDHKAAKPTPPHPPCCKEGLPPAKFSEKSLYSIDATWTADVGREVRLDALRGRPQVMALFFTNCQHSCPLIVKEMKDIQKALPPKVRGKVDFLLVSIDPERDTTEALKAFRVKHRLEIDHWSLLRGSPDAVKRLAEMVGFRYMPGSNLQYAHSLLISVLNPSGEIVFQQSGLGNTSNDIVDTLGRLVGTKTKASSSNPAPK